jgi:hypothetical protein
VLVLDVEEDRVLGREAVVVGHPADRTPAPEAGIPSPAAAGP